MGGPSKPLFGIVTTGVQLCTGHCGACGVSSPHVDCIRSLRGSGN